MATPAQIRLANGTLVNALVSIVKNGTATAFPEPSSYKATMPIITSGGRNADGDFIGQYVNQKYKIELGWKFLTVSQWAQVLNWFSGSGNFTQTIIFFSELTGQWEEKEFYPGGDFPASVYLRDNSGNIVGYKDLKLSLIQV